MFLYYRALNSIQTFSRYWTEVDLIGFAEVDLGSKNINIHEKLNITYCTEI